MQKRKRRKSIKINITLTNRWLYTLILIGILIAVGIGVYAYGTNSPSTFGHSRGEIEACGATQTLKMNAQGTAWICGSGQLDCRRVESTLTRNPIATCPSGYISTGGGAWCQSAFDRLLSSQPFLQISPSSSGWTAACYQTTTNTPSNGMAYVICCKS